MPISLPPPQLLEIQGADAVAFAHAQFTSDVRALAVGAWQWSAWLSAQGRVRFFFRLLRNSDISLTLVLQGGSAEDLCAALVPYVFRSKVALRCLDRMRMWGYEQGADLERCLGAVPRTNEIVVSGGRTGVSLSGNDAHWIVFGDLDDSMPADESAEGLNRWRLAEIRAGIVTLDAECADRYLPFWIGLHDLGAIALRKGCYPGQEIVARLHFKGGNKRELRRVEFRAAALPSPGAALHGQEELAIGEILKAAWSNPGLGLALAILPLDVTTVPLTAPDLPDATFRVLSPDATANA